MAAAPTTTLATTPPPATPPAAPTTTRAARVTATTAAPTEVTLPAAPPTTLPPAPEPPKAVPAAPAFPGAGKVDQGETFFEKTFAYEVDRPLSFDGRVGAVKVPTVLFAVLPSKRRFGRRDTERVEVRTIIPVVDCPRGAGKWDYKVIVQLIDAAGGELQRLNESGSCENEAKRTAVYDAVPRELVPSIRGVKVRLEASKH
jgi:hypothetical protein